MGNFDLNDIAGYGQVGVVPTPLITGGGGNAYNAYLQNVQSSGSSLGSGADPWGGGLRTVGTNIGAAANAGYGGGFGVGGTGPGTGLGFNLGTGQLLLGGLNTLGSLWMAFEANKRAKEQFKFAKDVTNTNLANQISAYNTTLEDRIRSRAVVEGMSDQDAQSYIDTHKLAPRKL